ncbi:MAG: hypothetical protein A2V98_04865 [Planctomycetes bacterium RBG_16_64_12]|nr:MAG: hypothetical protein A2V98_04865 [Planctomycetes bacterium RBG_16_64_12]
MTRTGKTHLAKALVSAITKTGRGVIVYDPTLVGDGRDLDGWSGLVYSDWQRFGTSFWRSRGCFVVIDEAPDAFRDHRSEAIKMILRGRHRGHTCAMIAQRHILMDKSARNQASQLFAFRVNPDDSEALAMDWNCAELRGCHQLRPRWYYRLAMHGTPRLEKL